MTSNIAIFGTGSVGCVYGYILHKAGAKVTAVCRSNYDVVHKDGITIDSELWGETVHYRPHAIVKLVAEAALHGPFDYVLVCSKSFPNQAQLIHDLVSPSSVIVLVQNGIGIEVEYAQMYPSNTIISAVVWLPATQVSPGIVKMGVTDRIELGPYPSVVASIEEGETGDRLPLSTAEAAAANSGHEATERLAALFTAGGGHAPTFADIQNKRWTKLAINVAFNSLCSLARVDSANLLRSSTRADDLVVDTVKEVGRVAHAVHGYTHLIDDDFIDEALRFHRGQKEQETGGKEPSSLADVRRGRPVEVDAILGNVVTLAKKEGIDVPILECLCTLLIGLNFGITKPAGVWREPRM